MSPAQAAALATVSAAETGHASTLMLLGAGFSSLVGDADAAPTMAEAVTLAA